MCKGVRCECECEIVKGMVCVHVKIFVCSNNTAKLHLHAHCQEATQSGHEGNGVLMNVSVPTKPVFHVHLFIHPVGKSSDRQIDEDEERSFVVRCS